MASSTSSANPCDVSANRNNEERRSPSLHPGQSSEEPVPVENKPQLSDQNPGAAIPYMDAEYGCKFCGKKFSNKQALGGHQNAHKVERTLGRNARDVHDNTMGYLTTSSTPHLPSSYHTSADSMNRPYFNWPYTSYHHGGHIGYSSSVPLVPYGPRHDPGLIPVHSSWSPPVPRIPHFVGHPSPHVHNLGNNLTFPNVNGEGSSSLVWPGTDHQGLRAFARTLRIGPGENPGDGSSRNRANRPGEEVDESGLDLTLKL